MGNRKKLKPLKGNNAFVDKPLPDFIGKYNAYLCKECNLGYLTLDVDRGVTPMFMPCYATEGCTGTAVSAGYPEGDPPDEMGPPIIHWYIPSVSQMRDHKISVQQHVAAGGLAARATKYAPAWVKAKL